MRMRLHLDTKIGDAVILPIYELDYTIATQTEIYTEESSGTFGDGSKYLKFRVNNGLGAITDFLSASVPRVMEDNNSNCLFPYRLRYTAELGGYYYPITWFDEGAFTKLDTQPIDWMVSYKYLKYQSNESTRYMYSPHDAGGGGSIDQFVANECYTDNNRTFIRKYVTESNASFVCGQGYGYGGYTSYAIEYPLCLTIGLPTTGSPYNYSTGFYFHDTAGNAEDIGYEFSGDYTHKNPLYSTGYPLTPIFVHYMKDDTDYYGVAIIRWSSFDSDSIPTSITVIGITDPFWGESIIEGGESGVGEWGTNNRPNVSEGEFSRRSDNVTRNDNDVNSVSSLVTHVNENISGVYHNDMITIYNIQANVDHGKYVLKKIFKQLFSDDFWTNWENKLMNPLNFVLSLGLMPSEFMSEFESTASLKPLTLGGVNVTQRIEEAGEGHYDFYTYDPIVRIEFPAINIQKYFDGYADFAPFTTAILHLPFIGNVKLDVNKIAHGQLGVEYTCDRQSGNVIAHIWSYDYEGKSQYVANANGNCLYSLPLYASSQDGSAIGKIVVGITTAIAGVALQSPGLATGGIISATSGGMEFGTALSGREVASSGTLGGNNSLMSSREIWLEINRPNWVQNMYYQRLNGIPAEMSNCIANCNQDGEPGLPYDGYLEINDIELDGVNCTDSERSEILTLLQNGVYIRGGELLE